MTGTSYAPPETPAEGDQADTGEMEWWSDTRNISMLAAWYLNELEGRLRDVTTAMAAEAMYLILERPDSETATVLWGLFQDERDAATSSMLEP